MLDRLLQSWKQLTDALMKRVDYHALRLAEVIDQSADFATVSIQPDDPDWPPLSDVPLRLGVPGAIARVTPGASVLFGFEGGKPDQPFVLLWPSGEGLTRLTLGDGSTGSAEGCVARVGDAVGGQLTIVAAQAGPLATLTLTYTPPVGPPVAVAISATGTATVGTIAPGGVITSGADQVRA
jgi:hypothetical protein